MTKVIEKPETPGKTEYDKFKAEIPQIKKEINSLIIRNDMTEVLYIKVENEVIDKAGDNLTNIQEIQNEEDKNFRNGFIYALPSYRKFKRAYKEANKDISNLTTSLEQYNVQKTKSDIQNLISLLSYDNNKSLEENQIGNIDYYISSLSDAINALEKKDSKYLSNRALNPITLSDDVTNLLQSLKIQRNLQKNIVDKLNKGLNLQSKDVLKKIVLEQAGYKPANGSSTEFVNTGNIEKDPWGVRFTVKNSVSSRSIVQSVEDIYNKEYKAKKVTDNKESATEVTDAKKEITLNKNLLDDVQVSQDLNYYMHLLPAIRSNLPVQGGTDVPGAQPGLNFRIEHSIVKHKVPGFSPIYQPMGIESIKCTLVGCFTGADGLDLWSAQKQADFTKEDPNNRTTVPFEFTGRGDAFESLTKNITKGPAALSELLNVTRSYDAFQNAQEFYNLIVAQGKQVEVEINLSKNDMVSKGGQEGPFRSSVSGNPLFKAFIRRMDLYYVRADRCWFILDLEVTDSGLIGEKCLNLTVNIDGAVDLIQEAKEALLKDERVEEGVLECAEDFLLNKPTGEYSAPEGSVDVVTYKSEPGGKITYTIDLMSGYGIKSFSTENQTSTELIEPDDLFNIFLAADTGNDSINTRRAGVGIPNRIKANRAYARFLKHRKTPQPRRRERIGNLTQDITKGTAFEIELENFTEEKLFYFWDPETRRFYGQKGFFGGDFEQNNSLSVEEFLGRVQDQVSDTKRRELTQLLKQIETIMRSEEDFEFKPGKSSAILNCINKKVENEIPNGGGETNDTYKERGRQVNEAPTPKEVEEAQKQDSVGSDENVAVKEETQEEPETVVKRISIEQATNSKLSARDIQRIARIASLASISGNENSPVYSNSYNNFIKKNEGLSQELTLKDFKIETDLSEPDFILKNSKYPNFIYVKVKATNKTDKPLINFNNGQAMFRDIGKNETGSFYAIIRINNATDSSREFINGASLVTKRFHGFASEERAKEGLKTQSVNKIPAEQKVPGANNSPEVSK